MTSKLDSLINGLKRGTFLDLPQEIGAELKDMSAIARKTTKVHANVAQLGVTATDGRSIPTYKVEFVNTDDRSTDSDDDFEHVIDSPASTASSSSPVNVNPASSPINFSAMSPTLVSGKQPTIADKDPDEELSLEALTKKYQCPERMMFVDQRKLHSMMLKANERAQQIISRLNRADIYELHDLLPNLKGYLSDCQRKKYETITDKMIEMKPLS